MKRWRAQIQVRTTKYWLAPMQEEVLAGSVPMAMKRAAEQARRRARKGTHILGMVIELTYLAAVKKVQTAEEALAVVQESLERKG